ncbi:hypothetical protein PR002_g15954 [Phytophthora rubi]|uniref:Glycosyl hydrolase family 38 C-terminal domain-containing protein n=1 Tax=Phytophthora rubi TaxID=129364 RepID=A0A6A3KLL6_9STRA|nr:hypothetical protein PR002_g15954 [Phytophthora rubi]
MPRVAFKIDSSDTLEYLVNDDDEFHEIEWMVGSVPIDDKESRKSTERGAASLVDGQVEMVVHRRLLADDSNGVGEHLNETESLFDSVAKQQITKGMVVHGNFFFNVKSAKDGMRSLRSKTEPQFFRPLTAYRKPNEARLSHLYAVGEHAALSQPAMMDFTLRLPPSSLRKATFLPPLPSAALASCSFVPVSTCSVASDVFFLYEKQRREVRVVFQSTTQAHISFPLTSAPSLSAKGPVFFELK